MGIDLKIELNFGFLSGYGKLLRNGVCGFGV